MTESEYVQQLVSLGSTLKTAQEVARLSFVEISEADYDAAENATWDEDRSEQATDYYESFYSGLLRIPEAHW